MINVSDAFKKKLNSGGVLYEEVEITYTDGTTDTFDTEIMEGSNTLVDGAGLSSFPIGTAIEKYMTLIIDNREDQYADVDFYGAVLKPYLKMQLDDGTTERVKKGKYTITSPETYGETITLTALDDMYKADVTYTTNLSFPQNILNLVVDACNTCGITMGFSSMEHGDFVVESVPDSTTFRQFLGYAAMIEGANARIDVNGYLQFVTWDFGVFYSTSAVLGEAILGSMVLGDDGTSGETAGDYHVLKNFNNSPTLSSDDIVITGIKIKNSNAYYQYGSDGYVLEFENLLAADDDLETIAKWIGYQYVGRTFRSMSGNVTSTPLIEFGDMALTCKYIASTGETKQYITPITDVDFTLHSYTIVKTKATDPVRGSSTYHSAATQAIIKAQQLIEKEQTAREAAIEKLAETLADSSGLYITTEEQEDGSTIYYMHNKSTLDESDIVWKLTAEAIGISTDGGETYPYGFTVTGEMITRLLYAEGINADYINTGCLQVTDSDGNVMFSVNIDTGDVIINASYVTIGGESVESYVEGQLSGAITGNVTEYYKSTSATELVGGSWSTATPIWTEGCYIWVRTTITTGSGDSAVTTTSDPVCITGNTGASGSSGNDGASVTISSTEITYQASTSGTDTPTGDWTESIPEISQGQYLWTRTVVNYTLTASDGTVTTETTTSYAVAYIGADGSDGKDGSDGRGIVSTAVYYTVTDSGTYYPSFGDDGTTSILGVAELGKMILGNSGTWTEEIPEASDGEYLWVLTIFTYSDGTTDRIYSVSKSGETGAQGIQGLQGIQGEQGEQGIQGETGEDGKTSYFHIKYSEVESPTASSEMTETPSTYIGTYVDYTEADSTDPADYTWVKWIGEDGAQGIAGTNGADGKTYYLHIAYANSEDGKTDFSVDDSTGKSYIGQYTDTEADDSTDYTKYSWTKIKGEDGADGSDGVGIQSIKNYYLATSASSGVDVSTSGWTETVQSVSATKKYLWNYETVTLTDGNTDISTPCIIGAYGDTGATGEDGVSISDVQEYYAVSTTNSTAPTTWDTTVPDMSATNKYLWNYEVITYSNGSTSETAKRVIGVYGDTGAQGEKGATGADGADGASVTIQSTKVTYQATSSGTETPSGSWSESVPEMEAGQYLWTRTVVTYLLTASDGTTSTVSTTSYSVSYIGADGSDGSDGVSVESVTIYYALSESSTYAPTHGGETTAILGTMVLGSAILGNSGEWYTEAPEVGETEYLWSCFLITYSNGVTSWTEPCCLTDDSTRNLVSSLSEQVYEFEASVNQFLYQLDSLEENIYTNYSTTEELEVLMNAKIEDSEATITSAIEATYATMEYADGVAATAESAANGYTDGQLASYYTVTQTNEIIQEVTDEINSISLSVDTVTTNANAAIKTYKIYYAVSSTPDYYPTHGDDGTTAVLGTAVLGKMVLGNSGTWAEEQPDAADGEYIWVSYYIEYVDGTTEWTEPTLLTDAVARDSIYTLTEQYAELLVTTSSISLSVTEAITTAEGYADKQIEASLVLKIEDGVGVLSTNVDHVEFSCGDFVINGDNGGQFTFDSNGNATFSGTLSAASGSFSGTITAAAGSTIGGWTLTTGKIYSGDESTGVAVMQAPKSDTVYVFAAGGTSHSSYEDCPFRVDKAGKLFSSSAEIGGWTVGSYALKAGDEEEGTTCMIQVPASSGSDERYWVFAAGGSDHSDHSDCTFRVGSSGEMYAGATRIIPKTSYTTSNTGFPFWVQATNDTSISTSETSSVLFACGVDSTSGYIRSYPTRSRVYTTSSEVAEVVITTVGTFGCYSSSSARYKNNINYFDNTEYASEGGLAKRTYTIEEEDYREDYRSILRLPVVQHRYNEGYISGEPDYDYSKYTTNFIAEDVAKICPAAAVYNADGEVESWDVKQLIPRMVAVIQELNRRITELEATA